MHNTVLLFSDFQPNVLKIPHLKKMSAKRYFLSSNSKLNHKGALFHSRGENETKKSRQFIALVS
jgi:hypothetical protein